MRGNAALDAREGSMASETVDLEDTTCQFSEAADSCKELERSSLMQLFMELQVIGDRTVKKHAFSHIVHSIRRMNQKSKNESKNRKLQNILCNHLKAEEESRAKRAFTILYDLHRRRVWIMIAAISYLLRYENAQHDDDTDASSSEDEATQNPQIILSKEDVYKVIEKAQLLVRKKKKAKLQRVIRSLKRQQRKSAEATSPSCYSPLTYLKDPQAFAEKVFSQLQKCNERFEVRMMMLKVISRTIGLHHLVLLNFYPYLQRYVQPHQRDVTTILAAAVQACHDMVPPDAVKPLFKQIVKQFVHDRSRPEAIAVGLNVVREICMRMPLMMNEDLLQDLVLYKRSHEKAVSIAARSLVTLFREIWPSLLVKKDRGRPVDPARPKAFGEVTVASDVPSTELLNENISSEREGSDDESDASDSDDEGDLPPSPVTKEIIDGSFDAYNLDAPEGTEEEDDKDEGHGTSYLDSSEYDDALEDYSNSYLDGDADRSDEDIDHDEEMSESINDSEDEGSDQDEDSDEEDKSKGNGNVPKRKLNDYIGQLNAADASLPAPKRLAGAKKAEDFKRIKELKAKKDAKLALAQHGLRKAGRLVAQGLQPLKFHLLMSSAHVKVKLSKLERVAHIKAGRVDREPYVAKSFTKKKKTGGLSNKQKQHKKMMPLAATRAKAARSRLEKKQRHKRTGNQFRGRKAWK
ncbi:hypothetical protein EJB05_53630, partial [Eragrostis curvula]